MNPIPILLKAVEKVPFIKWALGLAGIAASAAIIKSFKLEESNDIPVISLLIMMGLMLLLFIFSTFTRSQVKAIQIAGYFLVFTTVIITCLSAFLLFTSTFFDVPKPINQYYSSSFERKNQKKDAAIKTIEKSGMSWIKENKEIRAIQVENFNDLKFQRLIPSFVILQPEILNISFDPMPRSMSDMFDQNKFTNLNELDKVHSLKSLSIKNSFFLTNIEALNKLKLDTLQLTQCFHLKNLDGIKNLSSLISLNLKSSYELENLRGIENLINLRFLSLEGCKALRNFNPLIRLKSLAGLNVSNTGLSTTDNLNRLTSLQFLDLHSCFNIKNLDGLNGLYNLYELNVANCVFLEDISALSTLKNIRVLSLQQCPKLKDISALKDLKELQSLSLSSNFYITDLEPLKNLKNLKELYLIDCKGLQIEQIADLEKSLPNTKIEF